MSEFLLGVLAGIGTDTVLLAYLVHQYKAKDKEAERIAKEPHGTN